MHFRFSFDACPVHSPFGFVHLTQQNLSARALFCNNLLAKVNTQLLIYKSHSLLSLVKAKANEIIDHTTIIPKLLYLSRVK